MKISDTPYLKQPLISPTPLFLREKPEPPTPRLFLVKFGVERITVLLPKSCCSNWRLVSGSYRQNKKNLAA